MFFGVDIGGTSIKIGAFNSGKLVEKWQIKLDFKTAEELVDVIYNSINSRYDSISGIGIGCPGFIVDNFIYESANIHFLNQTNLVTLFHLKTDAKIRLVNDANAAALGEAYFCGYKNLLFVTLGTGVGGGLVVNGNILEGAHGAGMELGHLHNDDTYNFTCGCGKKGCVETLSSATGLVNIANSLVGHYQTNIKQPFNAKKIFDGAKVEDELATKAVEIFSDYLGKALANACILVDPGIIMLGGGVSNAGDFLLEKVQASFQKYALKVIADTKIILAALGDEAGMYGAYYLVANKEA